MPRFTIGIPTYNRAGYLKRSLASAIAQTYPDVEVIVSDNASTDNTAEVAQSYGDRVRYHRNETNLGMWPNFLQVAELARGDYFAWLQDDDLIHHDFARRAVEVCDANDDVALYTAYSADTHSHDTFIFPLILGPPIAMDWMSSKVRIIEGSMVLPVSFFLTFSMPPVTAYRTSLIRSAIKDLDPTHFLYNERILQSRAVADHKIAVDPYIAGVFFKHENQASLLAGSCDIPERSRQWVAMVNEVSLMLAGRSETEWRHQLDTWFASMSMHHRLAILSQIAPPDYWHGLRPLALEVCMRYLDSLPPGVRQAHVDAMNPKRSPKTAIIGIVKQITPPLIFNVLRSIKNRRP